MTERPCKACGRRLRFLNTPDGKTIPLDLVSPVYELHEDPETGADYVQRSSTAFVSHFATCPKAGAFSAKGARR